jgi:hypothetical protein
LDLERYYLIQLSSYAGAKGGLGALSLAKASKVSLERALTLDDQALQASAYNSLGALYHKVSGWPLAFGSDKKARSYLFSAIKINPTGIDPNHFYGEYLFDKKINKLKNIRASHASTASQ